MKELLSCSANNLTKKSLIKAERSTKNKFYFEPIQKINQQVDEKREKCCEFAQRANEITQNEPGNDVSCSIGICLFGGVFIEYLFRIVQVDATLLQAAQIP
jgi:hypothetical protein